MPWWHDIGQLSKGNGKVADGARKAFRDIEPNGIDAITKLNDPKGDWREYRQKDTQDLDACKNKKRPVELPHDNQHYGIQKPK